MKPDVLTGITVTCDQDTGNLTITGLPVIPFRSLLTAAALYRNTREDQLPYIDPDGPQKEICEQNAIDSQNWRNEQMDFLNYLSAMVVSSYCPDDFHAQNLLQIIAEQIEYRTAYPSPAWTNEKPPVDPQKQLISEVRSKISDVEETLRNLKEILK